MARPRKNAFDEATTDRVLRAAERAFGEHGYHRARLEDIAIAAQITRPSLLYHFKSKPDLYAVVLRRAFSHLRDALQVGLSTGETFEERLDATIASLILFENSHRGLMSVAVRELLDPAPARDGPSAREIIAEELLPIIDELELFIVTDGRGQFMPGLPVRAAIMQLLMGHMARASMGDVGAALWGGTHPTRLLSHALLLGRVPAEHAS